MPIVGPQLDLAGIQVNGRHLRRLAARRRELARLHPLDRVVTLGGPLLPQPLRDPLYVPIANGELRQPT